MDLYKLNIDYAKEKYNNLKKEFVESYIYYYIEQYKESVNQLIEANIEFSQNIYYEFIITDKFIIDNIHVLQNAEYRYPNEYIYHLGTNTIIFVKCSNLLIVHINR